MLNSITQSFYSNIINERLDKNSRAFKYNLLMVKYLIAKATPSHLCI